MNVVARALGKRARDAGEAEASLSQNVGQLISAADAARDGRRWQEAARLYQEHLDLRPDDAPIWVQLGHALKESGNLGDAETAYKQSLELAPDVADTQLQLGHLYKVSGHFSEALKCYEQAALLNPDLGDAKHEIQDVVTKLNSPSKSPSGQFSQFFSSVDQLIAYLKLQPADDDIFTNYFRSVSGH